MKPSWATGQTVSIREESIIDNGSFLGGQFSCALDSSPLSLSLFLFLSVSSFQALRHYDHYYSYSWNCNRHNWTKKKARKEVTLICPQQNTDLYTTLRR